MVVGIFVTNYVPGTYLIGWDSLQTELYPWLAVKRAFFSVWQEYQSFGLPSGMAHAADLLRALFIFFISFFMKQNMVRYFFHHLMLLVGGVGALTLFRYLGFKSKSTILAFLGAVFYVLNLGTIQIFALPFEPFSIFFASLPWLVFVFLDYVENPGHPKKSLRSFVIVNVLSTPAFYQQALFLVYLIFLAFLFLGLIIKTLIDKQKNRLMIYFKNLFFSLIIIFAVNSFWLLPQFYTVRFSANVTKQSKINQLATETIVNKNIEKGRLVYLARLENFYYDLRDINQEYLFSPWKNHFDNKFLYALSFIPFVFATVGVVFGRKKYDIPLATVFVFTFLIFMSGTAPLSFLWEVIREISILGQVFRSPFTKFVFPYVLVMSYFFILGLDVFIIRVKGLFFKNRLQDIPLFLTALIVSLTIVLTSLPAFSGNYFLPQMKLELPKQYSELFEYFEGLDKNKRIAPMPDYTFWGWYQNNWGYDGSGFIWYGIEQPVISRTFDVWSKESESYFWEMKRAVETQSVENFKNILNKYDIDYLLVDRSSVSITSADLDTQYGRVSGIIRNIGNINLVKSIDDIDIYEVLLDDFRKNFTYSSSGFLNAYPGYEVTDQDSAYSFFGDYLFDGKNDPDVIFPFIDFTTQTERFDRGWKITEDSEHFIITREINGVGLENFILEDNNSLLEAKIFDGENITYLETPVNVEVRDDEIRVVVKKVLVESFPILDVELVNCRNNLEEFGSNIFESGGIFEIYSRNRSFACFSFVRPFLAHWNGYIVKVGSENLSGDSLLFYIVGNKSNTQSKIEENLISGTDYFVLGNGSYYDDGYIFGFQNASFLGTESVNRLKSLEIYAFPFDYIKNIRFSKKPEILNNPLYSNFSHVRKNNYTSYSLSDGGIIHNTVVLNQAYDPGWLILCGLQKCNANHVKVNNWANGWVFENGVPENIKIVFWPQVLEYIGLVFFAISLILAFRYRERVPVRPVNKED